MVVVVGVGEVGGLVDGAEGPEGGRRPFDEHRGRVEVGFGGRLEGGAHGGEGRRRPRRSQGRERLAGRGVFGAVFEGAEGREGRRRQGGLEAHATAPSAEAPLGLVVNVVVVAAAVVLGVSSSRRLRSRVCVVGGAGLVSLEDPLARHGDRPPALALALVVVLIVVLVVVLVVGVDLGGAVVEGGEEAEVDVGLSEELREDLEDGAVADEEARDGGGVLELAEDAAGGRVEAELADVEQGDVGAEHVALVAAAARGVAVEVVEIALPACRDAVDEDEEEGREARQVPRD
mmetsp:Transcript_11697/g.38486  ORF Transcript_11697/g.38486 Transcript_11697/m.38486 type:complete len:289 (+) Transcript_11697:171-1037(+)